MELSIPKQVTNLVKDVFENENIKIVDWDLDRIYLENDDYEYTIRMWDITENQIRWTLFKSVDNGDGTGHGEELKSGEYGY